jgi:hypothetical protein
VSNIDKQTKIACLIDAVSIVFGERLGQVHRLTGRAEFRRDRKVKQKFRFRTPLLSTSRDLALVVPAQVAD